MSLFILLEATDATLESRSGWDGIDGSWLEKAGISSGWASENASGVGGGREVGLGVSVGLGRDWDVLVGSSNWSRLGREKY
jgi:hypothetical protein